MASWSKTTKHEPSEINNGNQYTRDDAVPIEQLNAITENSFYAVNKSEEALTKANSAFENNGTVVSVSGNTTPTLSFDSDPQTQIFDINDKILDLQLKDSSIENTFSYYALKNLSNVTYPRAVADGQAYNGSADRVIETYISSDGLTWYRKWASGWKECGGYIDGMAGYQQTVIPLEFTNVNYSLVLTPIALNENTNVISCDVSTKTTIYFRSACKYVADGRGYAEESRTYYACGY